MRIFLLIFPVALIIGCVRNNKIPKEVLPQNEMRKVMWDLMRADAYVADFIMKDSTRNQKEESIILYEKIFNIHSTTQETFKKSLAFYQSRPDLFKPIADSLRSDEKRARENQDNIKRPQLDSINKKAKLIRQPDKTGQ